MNQDPVLYPLLPNFFRERLRFGVVERSLPGLPLLHVDGGFEVGLVTLIDHADRFASNADFLHGEGGALLDHALVLLTVH